MRELCVRFRIITEINAMQANFESCDLHMISLSEKKSPQS